MSLRKLPRLRPGAALTAADYNRLVDQVNQLDFSVDGLDMVQLPGMRMLKAQPGGRGEIKRGKLDAELAFEATATVSLWEYDPDTTTWSDSGTDVEDVACFLLNDGETIAAGRSVYIARMPEGHWEVIAINCPPLA